LGIIITTWGAPLPLPLPSLNIALRIYNHESLLTPFPNPAHPVQCCPVMSLSHVHHYPIQLFHQVTGSGSATHLGSSTSATATTGREYLSGDAKLYGVEVSDVGVTTADLEERRWL